MTTPIDIRSRSKLLAQADRSIRDIDVEIGRRQLILDRNAEEAARVATEIQRLRHQRQALVEARDELRAET